MVSVVGDIDGKGGWEVFVHVSFGSCCRGCGSGLCIFEAFFLRNNML